MLQRSSSTTTRPTGLKIVRAALTTELDAASRHPPAAPSCPTGCMRFYGQFPGSPAPPLTPWMLQIAHTAWTRGWAPQPPDQLRLCDWSLSPLEKLRWHKDHTVCGSHIVVISLSDQRVIGFRLPEAPEQIWELRLDKGDVYVLSGAARHRWEHRVMTGGRSVVLSRNPHSRPRP